MISKVIAGIFIASPMQRASLAALRWVHPVLILLVGALTGNFGLNGIFILSLIIWWVDKGKTVKALLREREDGAGSFLGGYKVFDWVKLQANGARYKQKTDVFITENCVSRSNGEDLPWAKLVEVRELATSEWRLTFHVDSDKRFNDLANKSGLMARQIFGSQNPLSVTQPQSGVVFAETNDHDFLADPVSTDIFVLSEPEPTGNKCLALMGNGQPLLTGIAHTLVVGSTGSGKGSVLWAYIRSLLPAAQAGECIFYGIDPKQTELKGTEPLFKSLSFSPEKTADVLEEILEIMRERQVSGGRSFKVSNQNPLIFVAVDEFAAMTLGAEKSVKNRIDTAFFALMTQGRSAGIAILAMAQQPQKEVLGNIRNQFVMRVGLRLENATETTMVFGEGSVDIGVACHRIPAATAANNYATAGLGWAQHETGQLVKARFPYTSDAEIDQILLEAKVWNVHP